MKGFGSMKWSVAALCGLAVIVAGCASSQLTGTAQAKFEEYKTQSYPDFKAFAFDPGTGGWGLRYGYLTLEQAIEAALLGCGRNGPGCEIHALGKTVVLGMSPGQLAMAKKAYETRILGDVDRTLKGQPLTSGELKQNLSGRALEGTLVTGAGFAAEIKSSGIISGRLSDTERRSLGRLRRADVGAWWIEENEFCWQFNVWFNGQTGCQAVVKDGDTFKFYADGELVFQGAVKTN